VPRAWKRKERGALCSWALSSLFCFCFCGCGACALADSNIEGAEVEVEVAGGESWRLQKAKYLDFERIPSPALYSYIVVL
jgi:hypothetical protein